MMLQACHLSCAILMVKAAKIQNENQKFGKGFQRMAVAKGRRCFPFLYAKGQDQSTLYNGWSMMENLKAQITI